MMTTATTTMKDEVRLRSAWALLDACISVEAETARAAAALFVDPAACASLWHAAEQSEAERVVRDATVAASVNKATDNEGLAARTAIRGTLAGHTSCQAETIARLSAHEEATAMGFEDAAPRSPRAPPPRAHTRTFARPSSCSRPAHPRRTPRARAR